MSGITTVGTTVALRHTARETRTSHMSYKTSAMKRNDQKAKYRPNIGMRRRHNVGRSHSGASRSKIYSRFQPLISRVCWCFQCVPIRHDDQRWATMFQCPEINIASHIVWFLPQQQRIFFSGTSKNTFIAYKMALPRFTRICTMVTRDGLLYNDAYYYALFFEAGRRTLRSLFPRTIFGGISKFLDFDEIDVLSLTHSFIRLYVKSQLTYLQCMKVQDVSDRTNMFRIMTGLVRAFNQRQLSIMFGNDNLIRMQTTNTVSDYELCRLAGMDRLYKRNIAAQVDTFRQDHEGRYGAILFQMCARYCEGSIPLELDIVLLQMYLGID